MSSTTYALACAFACEGAMPVIVPIGDGECRDMYVFAVVPQTPAVAQALLEPDDRKRIATIARLIHTVHREVEKACT